MKFVFMHWYALVTYFLSFISVPPRVRAKPEDGNIVVKKGTEVTLECSASGNPVPKVTWTREVSIMDLINQPLSPIEFLVLYNFIFYLFSK